VPSRRVRGLVAYDGTSFHGWARQPGLPTIQGVLEDCLEVVLKRPTPLVVAGRTDAGVHAFGQVVSFDCSVEASLDRLRRSVDRMAGPEIALRSLEEAASDFSARHSATARRYLYRFLTEDAADPFRRRYAWHVGRTLDVGAMAAAATPLLGEHDFTAYCKAGAHGGPIRRLTEIDVREGADGAVDVWVEAANFCHQMVRSIAGALADVGVGRRDRAYPARVLEGRDRAALGTVAPPNGLTLWSVAYG